MPQKQIINLHDELRRLQWLRDFAIAAVGVLALIAEPVFYTKVPLAPVFALLGLWTVISIATWIRLRRAHPVSSGELLLQIGLDLVLLTILLALSGGAANPLTALYLPTVAIAAAVLPMRHAWCVVLLGIAAYSMLWKFSLPLVVEDVDRAMQMHLTGMWLTFVASAVLITGFIGRITAALREREHQLAAAREQALRDEKILALGNLAAGTAHELGTPLATMAVIAGEWADYSTLDDELRHDLQILNTQIAACKSIISSLAERAGLTRPEGGRALSIDSWIEQLVTRWKTLRPHCSPQLLFDEASLHPAPHIISEMTIEQALLNLFNNAADASPDDVEIRVCWRNDVLNIDILDRGPGMDDAQYQQMGHQPLDSHNEGAGIGLLLAHATLHRYGGNITMEHRNEEKGLIVHVKLPLKNLLAESHPSPTMSHGK